jgi:hypothetical protein
MNYIEFVVRIIVFAVTLFLLLEFIVACETDTWKAALAFGSTALVVITLFFLTKQHLMERCPNCNSRMRKGVGKSGTKT